MPDADDFAKYIEKYLAEVPGGAEGDRQMRRRDPSPFIDTTAADIRPDTLSDSQIESWFQYMSWNLWELIATRSTEGESGLIPRQEYETLSFVQQWSVNPDAMRLITEKVGVDGLVELGRVPRREVGTKVNHIRNYASALMAMLGRGVCVSLEQLDPTVRRDDIQDCIQFARRTWHGTWGDGPGLASGRGFVLPDFTDWQVGPLRVRHGDPHRHAHVTFEHEGVAQAGIGVADVVHPLEDGGEDRHVFFDADADEKFRESLAYLLPLPDLGLAVIVYTFVHAAGRDGRGRAGSMAIVYGPGVEETVSEVTDGILVPDAMDFDDWRVGHITLSAARDMTTTDLRFAGERIVLEYRFAGINPPFAFLRHPGGCPSWLADDRTEQGGRVVGSLTLDGVRHEVDTFGHRDHSWGMRDWGGATHWKWWNLMAPDVSIHCMELQFFGRTTLHGYVHRDGVTSVLTDYDVDVTFDDQILHTALEGTFTDEDGRVTRARTWRGADLHWPISPHLTLHEAGMHAEIEGVPGAAYIEMAWPPAYITHHAATAEDGGQGLAVDRPVELSTSTS